MSGAELAALLLPTAVALPVLGVALRAGQPTPPPLALRLGLAFGLGIGLGSCAFFLALVLGAGSRAGMAMLDAAFAALLLASWWRNRRGAAPPPAAARRWPALDVGLAAACGLAAAAFLGLFAAEVYARPHGEMDAWMSWDVKARFLAAGGARWRLPFEDFFGHPDYPLLLPAAVAHGWRYGGGRTDQALPIAIAALFAAATVALLFGGLAGLRGRTVGLLGALCLLATPGFARRAAWLYGDVPLAFYALASLVLCAYWERAATGSAALRWAGLAAGLAAWTKREGLLFLFVLFAVSAWSSRGARRWRALGGLALGAAGPVALLVCQRSFASRAATTGRGIDALIARLADPGRYAEIAAAVWRLVVGSPSVWLALAVPLFALLMGGTANSTARASARHAALVVASLAALYVGIYLTTPANLDWHLRTSLDRLMFHLWPSIIFAAFLWAAGPDERGGGRVPGSR